MDLRFRIQLDESKDKIHKLRNQRSSIEGKISKVIKRRYSSILGIVGLGLLGIYIVFFDSDAIDVLFCIGFPGIVFLLFLFVFGEIQLPGLKKSLEPINSRLRKHRELQEKANAYKLQQQERAFSNKLQKLVILHVDALAIKRSQTLQIDDYGNVFTEKWEKEVVYFIDNVFLPSIGNNMSPDYLAIYKYINAVLDDHENSVSQDPTNILSKFSPEMDPYEYEHFCSNILTSGGWDAEVTKGSGDQGVDVIARKNDLSVAIQCKLYTGKIGNKAVQEAHTGKDFYRLAFAVVVSNALFSQAAKTLAKSLNVHLLHHRQLVNLEKILLGE